MDLRGKKALVTGGAVRLGQATVCALAEAGSEVVIHCRHSRAEARALRDALIGRGAGAHVVQGELSSEEACRRVVGEAEEAAGGLDILVNNASTFEQHRLREITEPRLLDAFWSNLFAPVLLTRAFAEQAGQGRIVNLLDRRVTSHDTGCVPYLLAKKALAEFTAVAALDLAPDIAVNAVAPGAILPPPGEGQDYLATRPATVPLKHQCTAEEIAAAVVYLLRNDAVTGQVLFIDGGQHLQG
jgi:NAD(P)-dependent dehydrogenase (short-subunit alcohol dehydrogenase family)